MPIVISPAIRKKLADKHQVTEEEIHQCFANMDGNFLKDTRDEHQTEPPSWWFVAETNQRRKLKIIFIARPVGSQEAPKTNVEIKSAFPPDDIELELYARRGQ